MDKYLPLIGAIGGLVGILSLPLTYYISIQQNKTARKRAGNQDYLDNSITLLNQQKLIVELQLTTKEQGAEINRLRLLLEKRVLSEITLRIGIDQVPIITSFK